MKAYLAALDVTVSAPVWMRMLIIFNFLYNRHTTGILRASLYIFKISIPANTVQYPGD